MPAFQEHIPLRPKTTMRIGGEARYFAELSSKADCEEAYAFAREKHLPLIVLGGGSNTIFADGVIEALVVRLKAERSSIEGNHVHVEAGKNLPQLINELAEQNLDLSPLTGIPGTIGGAIFGNAGQGFGGTWMSAYVKEVEAYAGGEWQTFSKNGLHFGYRFSAFKEMVRLGSPQVGAPMIWSVILEVPSRAGEEIRRDVERLLQKRIETQPHVKTAGSCFLSLSKETPAWKVIAAAGFRGKCVGDACISEKHANFLINQGEARFQDVRELIENVQWTVETKHASPLHVEMRCIEQNGTTAF